ncbi:hypothetical protein [Nannocystis bainbridge]|uniref:Uncharacterized protein n=1 Tax=Nannocystis bainbridge TaxID=2995303 RepID=A0ABT5E876_9BACT|nr:hypothetical protein [Nannocystis bainbridge]MDC0722059.1 hypothetical protein [Nannocystis bainbridge]
MSTLTAAILGFACEEPPPMEQPTGALCSEAADCYPELDHSQLGTVFCEDQFDYGYCTHTCETDADCCAVEGECMLAVAYVCTPLANDTSKRCWISCEEDARLGAEPMAYCFMHAGPNTVCRSSGGGSEKREVCLPP